MGLLAFTLQMKEKSHVCGIFKILKEALKISNMMIDSLPSFVEVRVRTLLEKHYMSTVMLTKRKMIMSSTKMVIHLIAANFHWMTMSLSYFME